MKVRTTERKRQVTVTTRTHTLTLNDAEARAIVYLLEGHHFGSEPYDDEANAMFDQMRSVLPEPMPGSGIAWNRGAAWVMTGEVVPE